MFRSATGAGVDVGPAASSAGQAASAPAIGELEIVAGAVAITRANVIIAQPTAGDPVYCGDMVETGSDGSAAIAFVDGTAFHLYAGTRVVLDEFICGTEKSANSALLRVVKGMFRVVAGRQAAAGRPIVETPFGQICRTGSVAGIGSLAFGVLTFGLIHELRANPAASGLQDDGTIDWGVFTVHIPADPAHYIPAHDVVIDTPSETYVFYHRGSSVSVQQVTNSPQEMALLNDAYSGALHTYEEGQHDPFIQQWQHANAQPQSTGAGGSSTSPTILTFNDNDNNNQPQPNNPGNTPHITTTDGGFPPPPTTLLDILPPSPPPPPTVKPAPEVGIESPNVSIGAGSGGEGLPIPLNLGLTLNGGSLATLVVSNIPVGATLSDGTVPDTFTATTGHTSVNVSGWMFADLTLTAPNDTNFSLVVTATALGPGGMSAPGIGAEPVTVNPLPPTVLGTAASTTTPVPATGVENTAIALNLAVQVNGEPPPYGDAASTNKLASLVVSDIPDNFVLSDGTNQFAAGGSNGNSVDVSGWNYNSLTITPPTDYVGDFTLSVAGSKENSEGNLSTTVTVPELVTVNPPELTVQITPLPTDNLEADLPNLHGELIYWPGKFSSHTAGPPIAPPMCRAAERWLNRPLW